MTNTRRTRSSRSGLRHLGRTVVTRIAWRWDTYAEFSTWRVDLSTSVALRWNGGR